MTDPRRVMLDIETLGTDPGAVVLSVGACVFTPGEDPVRNAFYREIDIASSKDAGLHVDPETADWWREQGVDVAPIDGGIALDDALADLSVYVDGADEVWANSPKFDASILEAAYRAVDQSPPWEFWELRDVRTVRALSVCPDLDHDGREHHALDDATHQAREVAAALARLD
jgi:hypothetical protein